MHPLHDSAISRGAGISQDDKFNDLFQNRPEEYDFIIVGAGSAGCVVANRLSENARWNVLLLEAGKEEPSSAEVPAFPLLHLKTQYDWNYATQPENNSCYLKGIMPWSRGKVMGGSSTLSFMMYVRGNREDYNSWERMGNLGWSYNDVLPYFIKSEDNRDPDILSTGSQYHGTGGYLTVERFPYRDPNAEIMFEGFQELGMKSNDINGQSQLGSMIVQTTSRNGSRLSTNRAFIRPIRRQRPNLFIKNQVYVTKILIDPETRKAFGVEYISTATGIKRRVRVRKEVIVSAGTIESPKLLMLSGIGPREDLEKHDIPVMKNLPVGRNLHDHVGALGIFGNIGERNIYFPSCNQSAADLDYYLNQKRGPLASTGLTATSGFFQTKYEENPKIPDVQVISIGLNSVMSYYDKFVIIPALLTTKSRGFVKLNDYNPTWGTPQINPQCFKEEEDFQRLKDATRMVLRIFNTTVFKENNFTIARVMLPPCHNIEFNSDEYWNCVVRNFPFSMYEPVGTCKMGPKEDSEAVVDSNLRVYGVLGLRVVDASIIPVITRGNINAPTIMIAEKASDMIKKDWSWK